MLPGFQLKCSARKIEVFVFVIIIKFLVVPKFMITKKCLFIIKKKLVSKNILKSNWRAHIIHSFVQINCIVLPIEIKISSVQSLSRV